MKKKGIVPKLCFTFYAALMLWLLFGQRLPFLSFDGYTERLSQNINTIPFFTINNYITLISKAPNIRLVKHAIVNLAGNVVMFIPLGFFLPLIKERFKSFIICLLSSTLIILCVEAIQLVTLLGSCDIDDLILNLAGVIIGYVLYKISTFVIFKK